jgi:hypothetical protein
MFVNIFDLRSCKKEGEFVVARQKIVNRVPRFVQVETFDRRIDLQFGQIATLSGCIGRS